MPILGSVDPNGKTGPVGPGTQQFLANTSPFNYLVFFENLATATAPAQQVVVTDQLDTSTLDLSTFSLGPISFGGVTLTPPAGLKQFSAGVDLRPSNNLIAKVDAALNAATGLITWRFTSLDPSTEQLTTDATAGFLPPDVTPPQGEGQLLYTITPKSGMASGTTICNQATVTFDANAPISTPNWCNTLDTLPPVSQVQAFPATEPAASFTVQWSGTDAGSGIQYFTIYVSDNGGAFTVWLANTTATQATFTGVNGHTYGFYSIARDLVGNVEGPKTAAEALTTVSTVTLLSAAQVSTTASGLVYSRVSQTFNGTATVTNISGATISGPFQMVLTSLTSGVTLRDATGTFKGSPYITVPSVSALAPGQSATVNLQFSDPSNVKISFTPVIYSGGLN